MINDVATRARFLNVGRWRLLLLQSKLWEGRWRATRQDIIIEDPIIFHFLRGLWWCSSSYLDV